MKARVCLAVGMLAAIMGCSREPVPAETNDNQALEENVFVQDEVVVRLSDEMVELVEKQTASGNSSTKSAEFDAANEKLGVSSIRRLFPYAGEFEERTRKAGLHKWYVVRFDETHGRTKASESFASVPGIELVEPVFRIKNTAVFNDPNLKLQWHYSNDGSLSDKHVPDADINVVPVWENYTTGNQDVIVAVVDGGIDQSHEDLKPNLIGGKNYVSGGKIKAHSHGTHVAGTIAAVNNNGLGVCGIAGGDAEKGIKGVKLWSAQIFESESSNPDKDKGTSESYTAIKEAADHGAVISQNSWGSSFETKAEMEAAKAEGIPKYARDAIDYFIKYAGMDASGTVQTGPMAGGVVIFAAGNDGWDWALPAAYDPVIAVGSIAPDYTRAYYSNYGSWVDVAAPGGSAEYGNAGEIYSTLPGNKYGYMQGTSMACPHVSGVAALLVSHFGGQGFTNEMLLKKLLGGTRKVVPGNAGIGQLVDALGAFTYGGKIAPLAPTISAEASSNRVSMRWKVTSDKDDGKAYGYVLLVSENKSDLENIDFNAIPPTVRSSTVTVGTGKVGEVMSGTVDELEFEHDYYAAAAAYDYNRNYSGCSNIVTVKTKANNPPVISTEYTGDYKIKSHETLRIEYCISDVDGHEFSLSLAPGSAAVSGEMLDSETYLLTFVGNADVPGEYEAILTATDKYGASSSIKIDYEIMENHAPVVIKPIGNKVLDAAGSRITLDMTEFVNDPDGETLSYTAQITHREVLHINPAGNILHVTALSYGLTDVTVTATDSRGLSCSLSFKVLVKEAGREVELYPNPVRDFLNIRTSSGGKADISIYSVTGQPVFHGNVETDVFSPASLDLRGYAPGKYVIHMWIDGKKYVRNIVKI